MPFSVLPASRTISPVRARENKLGLDPKHIEDTSCSRFAVAGVRGMFKKSEKTMLKQEEKVLIRTALMEYRYLLFKTYHGTDDEKSRISQVNKLLQSWKI